MKKSLLKAALAAAVTFAATAASAALVQSLDFNSPITLGATPAPNTWYTDRYAPAGFVVSGGQLTQTINSADSATNRPGTYSGAFYNTQGRKLDMPTGTTGVNVDLYVPDSWANTGQRMAGLWGTAFNASNVISRYPIIEFTSDGATSPNPRFRAYDNGVWIDLGIPTDIGNDDTYNLGFELNGGMIDYLIDGVVLASINSNGSTYIGNTILQGHNNYAQGAQGSYDIVWGRGTTDVPEPASLALAGVALMGLGLTRRRKVNKQA